MKPKIGITMGDPGGVGPEIAIKGIMNPVIRKVCHPYIIGDRLALERAMKALDFEGLIVEKAIENGELPKTGDNEIPLINLRKMESCSWRFGEINKACGEASFEYIRYGIKLAMEKRLDGIVTGPINKEAIKLAGHDFSGHTEILAHFTKTKRFRMLLVSEKLKVIHVTTHASMRNVCDMIKKERVYETITLADETLRLLGVEKPRIGIAGFNPHCSENGLFGDEEALEIIPGIEKARERNINVVGPISPDIVFSKAVGGEYDIVVAMYHDQGHIPIKLLGFEMNPETHLFSNMKGVNCTVGLPIIRTSVDHGTAFDIAGKGIANESSLIEAILLAAKMAS